MTELITETIHRHSDAMFRLIVKIVGDRDDAKDILQEVFVKSLSGLKNLRDKSKLKSYLYAAAYRAAINARRDAGIHSLGEIWRRHRVSCPGREQLGSFLLQVLPEDHANYIRFHLETTGCRVCQANLDDMRRQQEEAEEVAAFRRTRYFQSSAGYLRNED